VELSALTSMNNVDTHTQIERLCHMQSAFHMQLFVFNSLDL